MSKRRDDQTTKEATTIKRSASSQAQSTEAAQPSIKPSATRGLPKHARPADLLALQRTVGNRAVQRMVQRKSGVGDEQATSSLRSGIENVSGHSMDDVRVHHNASQPAQLQAHAYAQGTDIHLAPGEEQILPHEVWHVLQQKQGRVKSTVQLEREDEA